MAAKGKDKGKNAKKPEKVYSDVNVCWKREKEGSQSSKRWTCSDGRGYERESDIADK